MTTPTNIKELLSLALETQPSPSKYVGGLAASNIPAANHAPRTRCPYTHQIRITSVRGVFL
jgi:hypothetical protein